MEFIYGFVSALLLVYLWGLTKAYNHKSQALRFSQFCIDWSKHMPEIRPAPTWAQFQAMEVVYGRYLGAGRWAKRPDGVQL